MFLDLMVYLREFTPLFTLVVWLVLVLCWLIRCCRRRRNKNKNNNRSDVKLLKLNDLKELVMQIKKDVEYLLERDAQYQPNVVNSVNSELSDIQNDIKNKEFIRNLYSLYCDKSYDEFYNYLMNNVTKEQLKLVLSPEYLSFADSLSSDFVSFLYFVLNIESFYC